MFKEKLKDAMYFSISMYYNFFRLSERNVLVWLLYYAINVQLYLQ